MAETPDSINVFFHTLILDHQKICKREIREAEALGFSNDWADRNISMTMLCFESKRTN